MNGYIQLARSSHKILRFLSLVRAHRDAPLAALLLALKHLQRGLALAVSVGLGDRRRSDQAVAVLHQSMAQIGQLRLFAIPLLVQSRIRVSSRFMRIDRKSVV